MTVTCHFPLDGAAATETLALALAPRLGAGDILALSGPIGAGKSVLARALIQTRLRAHGVEEDVPSPSFTLVQTYQAGPLEIWHCDLYRLTHADEVLELGLEDAFDTALTLIEWPERLGADLPARALRLDLQPRAEGDLRDATLSFDDESWQDRLSDLIAGAAGPQTETVDDR